MTPIPENTVTMADVAEWYRLKRELAKVKAAEALLRVKIFRFFFPNPTEGTNTFDLKDGTGAELKATHVINRDIDPGALQALTPTLRDEQQIPVDKLIRWKPELVLSEYRKLTAEEQQKFDQVLIIKPGSPQMEVAIPKKAKPVS